MPTPRGIKKPTAAWELELREAPLEFPELEAVAEDAWYRIVPIALSDEEVLPPRHGGEGIPFPLPNDAAFHIDRKVVGRGDVRAYRGDVVLVSSRFASALEQSGVPGCATSEVAHGTPRDVRGRRLHRLSIDAPPFVLDPRTETWSRRKPKKPASSRVPKTMVRGHEGVPVSPAIFRAPSGSVAPIGFTEWFGVGPGPAGFRGLLVAGAWLRALRAATPEGLELVVERVDVVGGGVPRIAALREPLEKAARGTPQAPTIPELVAHLESTAAAYAHVLGTPASGDAITRALHEASMRASAPYPGALEELFVRLAGASLFGGALQLFPVESRSEAALRSSGRNTYPNGLVAANDPDRCREWGLVVPPRWMVFGTRVGDPASVWAVSDVGRVHLLSAFGPVLGPGATPTEWLADQVADLEYAWRDPDSLPFRAGDWIGPDEVLRRRS